MQKLLVFGVASTHNIYRSNYMEMLKQHLKKFEHITLK